MTTTNDFEFLNPELSNVHKIGAHLRSLLRQLRTAVLARKEKQEKQEIDEAKARAEQEVQEVIALARQQQEEQARIEAVQRADQHFSHYDLQCTPCNRFGYPIG